MANQWLEENDGKPTTFHTLPYHVQPGSWPCFDVTRPRITAMLWLVMTRLAPNPQLDSSTQYCVVLFVKNY